MFLEGTGQGSASYRSSVYLSVCACASVPVLSGWTLGNVGSWFAMSICESRAVLDVRKEELKEANRLFKSQLSFVSLCKLPHPCEPRFPPLKGHDNASQRCLRTWVSKSPCRLARPRSPSRCLDLPSQHSALRIASDPLDFLPSSCVNFLRIVMMRELSIQSALRQVDNAAPMGSDLAGGPGRVLQR